MEAIETSTQQDYRVHLEVFEGPLDLLLYLIKKDDVDIYDIPVSKLLDQYLEYLNLARELNIDLAGEFLEMASELAYLKSKMLLPESQIEEEEEMDPRGDLVARLLEYRRYKMAAESLTQRPLLGRDVFTRPPGEMPEEMKDGSDGTGPQGTDIEADILSIVAAFQDLLKKLPREKVHEISHPRMGVAERVIELTERLKGKERVGFEDLFEANFSRIDIVVTFLAILEMAKQGLIRILQERILHKIYICSLLSAD